ncbi:hypothetical protein [Flavobacterium humidisoli]|uniref:Glycosyl transferase family 2 n=1 Tax=Flavobacterium humidisoli TaxID=2937442 RepID=A0ABY4LWP0_9FLAO|nr:hypothetical protein [Flavobacterium humidisoli]UPZ16046.1 hypothetical protein M0M44_01575 [Flavobacterium humidisoli]
MKIKVGYLLSYDYNMFFTSVKQVYDYVDVIFLAIDKNYLTWSGNSFEIEESFFEKVKKFDVKNKIEFYYDDFYVPGLSPMECDVRERNMLLNRMGDGWLIQLDVDEYMYDFKKIRIFLKQHWYLMIFPKFTPVIFKGIWITLFKKLPEGYLYIENNERFPFITNCKKYDGPRTNYSISNHLMNAKAIHQSWARSEEEIFFKITNWGHRDDFDTQKHFEFWRDLDISNYDNFKNIHPLKPELWDKLHYIPSTSIDDFIEQYAKKNKQVLISVGFFKMLKAFFRKIQKRIK